METHKEAGLAVLSQRTSNTTEASDVVGHSKCGQQCHKCNSNRSSIIKNVVADVADASVDMPTEDVHASLPGLQRADDVLVVCDELEQLCENCGKVMKNITIVMFDCEAHMFCSMFCGDRFVSNIIIRRLNMHIPGHGNTQTTLPVV